MLELHFFFITCNSRRRVADFFQMLMDEQRYPPWHFPMLTPSKKWADILQDSIFNDLEFKKRPWNGRPVVSSRRLRVNYLAWLARSMVSANQR